jgi:hypothetical protein
MEDWYPVRLAPRDGTPVILWIEDEKAPPTHPVTVGVWETDDMTRASHWRVFLSAGGRCLAAIVRDERSPGWVRHSAKPRKVRVGQY